MPEHISKIQDQAQLKKVRAGEVSDWLWSTSSGGT